MISQSIEQICASSTLTSFKNIYQTIDMYTTGTTTLYSSGKPFVKQMHSPNPFGISGFQENKLIDKKLGNVTIYSKIEDGTFTENIFYNQPKQNHKEKEQIHKNEY